MLAAILTFLFIFFDYIINPKRYIGVKPFAGMAKNSLHQRENRISLPTDFFGLSQFLKLTDLIDFEGIPPHP